MTPLDAYLSGDPPGYAVLIAGDWGVGKSFFWSSYQRDLTQRLGLTPITFSVAGLQTSDDLDRAFFQASIEDIGNPVVREAGALIGRALLRLVKVEPSDIKLKANVTAGQVVVCLDDIERFSGDFSILFGFIVNIVDATGVHCVLLADEKKALENHQPYGSYKERIVGKTIFLASNLNQFIEQTINNFDDARSKAILEHYKCSIAKNLENCKVSNLRTARYLITEIENALRNLPAEVVPGERLEVFVDAMCFGAISISRNASDVSQVVRAFSTPELGIVLAMREAESRKVTNRESEGDGDGERFSSVVELIRVTGFLEAAYSWPHSTQFGNLVEGRDVDYASLALEFSLIEEQKQNSPDPLTEINNYRNSNDKDLQANIALLAKQVMGCEILVLQRLFESYRSLLWMSESGIFVVSANELTERTIAAIGRISAEDVQSSELEFWTGPYNEYESQVIGALKQLADKANTIKRQRSEAHDRRALLTGSNEVDSLSGSIFRDVDAADFYSELLQAGRSATTRLDRFFRSRNRTLNAPDFVGDDQEFATQLADLIVRENSTARPLSIDSSLLLELSKTLHHFSRMVADYRGEGVGQSDVT